MFRCVTKYLSLVSLSADVRVHHDSRNFICICTNRLSRPGSLRIYNSRNFICICTEIEVMHDAVTIYNSRNFICICTPSGCRSRSRWIYNSRNFICICSISAVGSAWNSSTIVEILYVFAAPLTVRHLSLPSTIVEILYVFAAYDCKNTDYKWIIQIFKREFSSYMASEP